MRNDQIIKEIERIAHKKAYEVAGRESVFHYSRGVDVGKESYEKAVFYKIFMEFVSLVDKAKAKEIAEDIELEIENLIGEASAGVSEWITEFTDALHDFDYEATANILLSQCVVEDNRGGMKNRVYDDDIDDLVFLAID